MSASHDPSKAEWVAAYEHKSKAGRKVCLHIGTAGSQDVAACGRRLARSQWRETIRLTVVDEMARIETFVYLPHSAQCAACAARIHDEEIIVDGMRWALFPRVAQLGRTCASSHDTFSVALFCGALAGCWDARLQALLASDQDPIVLLDEAEQRGLHEGGWGPPHEEWLDVDPHGEGNNPHVWMPRTTTWTMPPADSNVAQPFLQATVRMCPCGMTELEWKSRQKEGRVWRSSGPSGSSIMAVNTDALITDEAFRLDSALTRHQTAPWSPHRRNAIDCIACRAGLPTRTVLPVQVNSVRSYRLRFSTRRLATALARALREKTP